MEVKEIKRGVEEEGLVAKEACRTLSMKCEMSSHAVLRTTFNHRVQV